MGMKGDETIFKVLFMGSFMAGKSTAINAMIGEDFLQAHSFASTAVIRQIVYGKDRENIKVFKDGYDSPEILRFEQFEEKYRLTDEDIEEMENIGGCYRFNDVDYATVESEGGLFRNGIQLIDSPGLCDAVARAKITNMFIPRANAVVFVLDAMHLFSDLEKRYIEKYFANADPKPRNVFFAVNRMNQTNDPERIRRQCKKILKPVFTFDEAFDEELYENRVFFVNAYGALQMRKEGREPVGTGMMEFEAALKALREETVSCRLQMKDNVINHDEQRRQKKMGIKDFKKKSDEIQQAVEECGVLVGPVGGKVEGVNTVAGLNRNTAAKMFRDKSEELKGSMFKVLVMGTFKNGKSTTINALIGRELLPVGATAATAVISQVLYGTDTGHVKIFKNSSAIPEVMPLEQFMEEYKLTDEDMEIIEDTGGLDRFSDVDYVTLESEHELFRDGVQLIDSPGLGEAVSRTKTTNTFIPQANAVVFLLDATHLFSDLEKQYIKKHFAFADPKPRNVFFVVNRMNQTNDPEAIQRQCKKILKPVFTVDEVFDEELYNSRVFFINAYGAFQMRKEGREPVGTGMVEFQAALEGFLSSNDKVLAKYQTALANMASVYKDAREEIANDRQLKEKSVDELQENRRKSEEKLKGLEEEVKSIEKTIEQTNKLVCMKILTDLEQFLSVDMPNTWLEHSEQFDEKFGITDMIKMALPLKKETKEELLRPMVKFINEFIEEQMEVWGDRVSLIISPEIDTMQHDLKDKTEGFDLRLSQAMALFSGLDEAVTDDKKANKLQLALSLIQGDYSVAVENAAGGNFNWGEFAKKYAVQGVINIIVLSLMGGGLPGLIVALLVEVVQMQANKGKVRDKLLNGMAEKLFPTIADELLANKDSITREIDQQFNALKKRTTETANSELADERKRQADIVEQASKNRAEKDRENARQDMMLSALYDRMAKVYNLLYDRTLDEENVDKLAAAVGVSE